MTGLADACAELAGWLPVAADLIAEPDTQPTNGSGTSTGSAAPWNTAAANAWFDAHATIRDTEQLLRYVVTGHAGPPRSWSDAALRSSLSAIERLGTAVPAEHADRAVRALTAATTAILQLPAIDRAEKPHSVAASCPYCGHKMLWVYPKAARIACLRGYRGECEDSDGNPPTGRAEESRMDKKPRIYWQDGLVT